MTLESMRTRCRVTVMLERLSEMIAEVMLWVDDKAEREQLIDHYISRLHNHLKAAYIRRPPLEGETDLDWSIPMDLAVNMGNLFDRPR